MASVAFNFGYFQTINGIFKIIQLVLGVIVCGLVGGGYCVIYYGGISFILFVGSICIILTFFFLMIHFLNLDNVATQVPWKLLELIYTFIAVFLYLIAWTVLAWYASWVYGCHGQWIAADIFAFGLWVLYIVDAIFLFRQNRSSLPTTSA